jgi:hypothetical protein
MSRKTIMFLNLSTTFKMTQKKKIFTLLVMILLFSFFLSQNILGEFAFLSLYAVLTQNGLSSENLVVTDIERQSLLALRTLSGEGSDRFCSILGRSHGLENATQPYRILFNNTIGKNWTKAFRFGEGFTTRRLLQPSCRNRPTNVHSSVWRCIRPENSC